MVLSERQWTRVTPTLNLKSVMDHVVTDKKFMRYMSILLILGYQIIFSVRRARKDC